MAIRITPGRACGLGFLALVVAGTAGAQPVYKDTERFARPARDEAWGDPARSPTPHGRQRPERRVDGGPGYVGSDYGLGKPAFTGLGSRPDWGRSE